MHIFRLVLLFFYGFNLISDSISQNTVCVPSASEFSGSSYFFPLPESQISGLG